jgi:1,4-alpha-glucan branching enzyme
VPGLARPVHEGGLGFDYRLSMGIPDHWIKLLKDQRDEDWHLGTIFGMLLNRRRHEKHVAYCESHDQALVGDKTIAFRLMDKAMYTDMARHIPNLAIDRGLALHKLIRLVTYAFGGDAWLNFMGNEFGHPEWIDFPREGNAFSYFYARRQWSLVDNPFLRYQLLNNFDRALHQLEDEFHFLGDPLIELLAVHEDNKLLAARRGPLVFLFNFHPTRSYTDYRFGVPDPAAYRVRLSTDLAEFGGFDRVRPGTVYPQRDEPWDERRQCVMVYLPSRTAQVLAPV